MSRKPKRRYARIRERGTTSIRCPKCRKPTRVLRTVRDDDGVHRTRVCVRGHRCRTIEGVAG